TPKTRLCHIIQIFGRRTVQRRALWPPLRETFYANDETRIPASLNFHSMQIPITMPQLGESIAEAAIINFLVKPGDEVEADQNLIEVETNKATMTVTSPCKGRIDKFIVQLHESYAVGATLGQIEATKEEAARLGLDVSIPG